MGVAGFAERRFGPSGRFRFSSLGGGYGATLALHLPLAQA